MVEEIKITGQPLPKYFSLVQWSTEGLYGITSFVFFREYLRKMEWSIRKFSVDFSLPKKNDDFERNWVSTEFRDI